MARPTRTLRPLRVLMLAGLVVAGGMALPVTAAQAATSTISLAVTGGSNNSQSLGTVNGTISGTAGATTATYSLTLCGQSTYPNARVTVTAGSASATHYVSYSSCQTFTGTLTSSYGITAGSATVYGSTFYPGNTYTTYSKTQPVSFGTPSPPPPPPTPPVGPVTSSFALAVTGGSNNAQSLGTANGSVTATRGGRAASYTVTLCGQSTYPSSSVTLTAGSASATHSVSYSSCQTFSGSLTSNVGISTATVKASGSTFYPGNTYTTYTKSRTLYF